MSELVTIEVWIHGMGCQRMTFYDQCVDGIHIKKGKKPLIEGTYSLFENSLTGADILHDISNEVLFAELKRRFFEEEQ